MDTSPHRLSPLEGLALVGIFQRVNAAVQPPSSGGQQLKGGRREGHQLPQPSESAAQGGDLGEAPGAVGGEALKEDGMEAALQATLETLP